MTAWGMRSVEAVASIIAKANSAFSERLLSGPNGTTLAQVGAGPMIPFNDVDEALDYISKQRDLACARAVLESTDIYAQMVAHVQVTQLLRTYEHEKALAVSEGYPAADKARNAFICAVCDLIVPAEEPVPCTRS